MLCLPFPNGGEPVSHEQSAPRGGGDPRRNAGPFSFGGDENLGMNVRVHGDGELHGRVSSWHIGTILP